MSRDDEGLAGDEGGPRELDASSYVGSRSGRRQLTPWYPPPWKATKTIDAAGPGCISPQGGKPGGRRFPTKGPVNEDCQTQAAWPAWITGKERSER